MNGSHKELQQGKKDDNQHPAKDGIHDQAATGLPDPETDPNVIVIPFGWMDKERTQDSLLRERTASDLSDHSGNVFTDHWKKTRLPTLGEHTGLVRRGASHGSVDTSRDDDDAAEISKYVDYTNRRTRASSLSNDLGTWSEEEDDVGTDSFEEMSILEKGPKSIRTKNHHEITFDGLSNGTTSGTSTGSGSRETTASSPGFSGVGEEPDLWCECLRSGSLSSECRECSLRGGGHELWCTSRTGVCPDCGKYLTREAEFKSRETAMFSSSKKKTGISNTSHSCISEHGGPEHESDGRKKKEKKKKKKTKSKKQDVDMKTFLKISEESGKTSRTISRRSYRVESKVNSHLPTVDPDIHRQAYVTALGDARLKKWRGDPWMTFHESISRPYFSYFPLWKNPEPEDSEIHIGIRKPDYMEKLKIRDNMKHIFGQVNVSDYYPTGKRFQKSKEEHN